MAEQKCPIWDTPATVTDEDYGRPTLLLCEEALGFRSKQMGRRRELFHDEGLVGVYR